MVASPRRARAVVEIAEIVTAADVIVATGTVEDADGIAAVDAMSSVGVVDVRTRRGRSIGQSRAGWIRRRL